MPPAQLGRARMLDAGAGDVHIALTVRVVQRMHVALVRARLDPALWHTCGSPLTTTITTDFATLYSASVGGFGLERQRLQ